ncbi:ParM/StbA family protein [Priestia aryabhattai]|uniref:ParM/StbA family protein n=1 Tax=Priestia megaterium TaxID=1404 RepID=UPI003F9A696A
MSQTKTKRTAKAKGSLAKEYIMGIDVGYSHTKGVFGSGKEDKDTFRSTVRDGAIDINVSSTVIEYLGDKLTIGERGMMTVNEDKIEDPVFEPLLLTSILRMACKNDPDVEDITVNLVTGLPIAWYPAQKDKLREFLLNKKITVGYKGKERNIHIKDCIVFPQSAGLALTNPKEFEAGKTNLVIDIGGLTVDVSQYEGGRIVKFESYQLGMLKFYARVRGAINAQFNVEVDDQDVERFIEEGFVTIAQKQQEFNFKKHFQSHMDAIMLKITTDFPYRIMHKVTYMGGGSLRFKDYLPENNGIKCNEVLSNAEAFYNVGVQKFG